jgi:hypothetical protein
MVCLCCVGREQLDEWQLYVDGTGKKLWYVCWRRDGSALEEEQLDEWQLYVEGRERAYGFLGEEMVCVGWRGTAGRVAIVR